jgi:hypothetical protein
LQLIKKERKMVKAKPCVACGRLTKRALFKGSPEAVFICSEACETHYFESLSSDKAARLRLLKYLDEKIEIAKKHELNCWIGAALGLILILFGIYFTTYSPTKELDVGPLLFMLGLIPLTVGALATRYFSSLREKLIMKRRQMA